MLSGGARRLAALYAVRPGTPRWWPRCVTAASRPPSLLMDAGVEAGRRGGPAHQRQHAAAQRAAAPGWFARCAARPSVQAGGRGHVRQRVARRSRGRRRRGARVEVRPARRLRWQRAGHVPDHSRPGGGQGYDRQRGHFALRELPDGVHAAGEVTGAGALADAERSGEIAGLQAAHALGFGDADFACPCGGGAQAAQRRTRPCRRRLPCRNPPTGERKGKCFACLCEDVTAKDIHLSVEEGYDSIELSKRYTTTTMGPCQGRMCQLPAVRLMAQETGQSLEEIGTTTARPPWHAVPMGALAGRPFEPAKRSAIHARHRELGATVMWAGDWRRAYDYGDPQAEALAVHESAGADRRLDARQADRGRSRRGRVPRPPLPESLLEPEAGPDPLRRDRERRRPH